MKLKSQFFQASNFAPDEADVVVKYSSEPVADVLNHLLFTRGTILRKREPYGFGIGKRDPYGFGIGKREPYEFGVGK